MNATVVITTKNRRDDLRKAVQSALEQTAKPQVLVIDDGSTDQTAEMIYAEFPQVILHRVETSQGYIVQRNRAAQLSAGDVIFSLDDDATFSTPLVVEQTLLEFQHPRVGAVAIPFINVNKDHIVHQRAPDGAGVFVRNDYIGTAHAVRRKIFLDLGGYRPYFFHQGEEKDFGIRLLDQGYVIRLGRADPIFHFESPRRDFTRMDLYGRRNDILSIWYTTPWPAFPVHLAMNTASGILFGFKVGRPLNMINGALKGYAGILHEFFQRKPVSMQTFRIFRQINNKAIPLEEIEPMLQPLKSVQ